MNNQEIKKCRKVMCDQNIRSKKEAQKWLLANHSDKGGVMDSGTFTDVTKCYQEKVFCPDEEEEEEGEGEGEGEGLGFGSVDAKTLEREKIYNCYRQTENWSKMSMAHRFDNDKFDTEKVIESIHFSSPKLEQLLSIIEQVDKNDMETHGKLFKHFIFSDVKAGGYGAKIIASALIANGYNSLLHPALIHGARILTLKKSQQKDDFNSFALLSSSAVYEFNITQRMKKEILQRYNRRPDNIHGKDMRFIILDSGFKEGIDLFDVKYVHIFELSMTTADLKQTIGRATRTCGQKGLNFEPNVGWPLYVYNYYIAIPDSIKDVFLVANKDLIDPKYADEPIFKNRDKLKEVTSLYSKFDKSLIKLTDQLYRLAPIFSVDFELTKNIHHLDDITYLYDAPPEALMYYGGAKRAISDKINCAGKCGLRSTKDIPATVGFLRNVYLKHKHNKANLPQKNAREYLCKYMKQSPDYCSQVNREWAVRAAAVPSMVHKKAQSRKLGRKLVLTTPTELSKEVMRELDLVPYVDEADDLSKYSIVEYSPHKEPGMKQNKPGPPPRKLNFTKMRDFIKTNYGEKFTWQPYIIENKCIDKPQTKKTAKKGKSANKSAKKGKKSQNGGAYAPPGYVEYINNQNKYMANGDAGNNGGDQASMMDYLTSFKGSVVDFVSGGNANSKINYGALPCSGNESCDVGYDKTGAYSKGQGGGGRQQRGGSSRIMDLNPTQNFIRTFFTPASPYKGMLLWHSVGTGKCHAKDTPIIMHDGSIKMVQDVLVGDKLMGDNSKPRMVLSLARGEDTLYNIIPTKGDSYTVNSEHILCLKYSGKGSISYVPNRQANLPYRAAHIDNKMVNFKTKSFSTREEAEQYLDTFTEQDRIVEIEVRDYINLSKHIQNELKGYRTGVEFPSKVVDFDPYIIGYWLGDGSKRSSVISSQDSCVLKYLSIALPSYGLKLVYQSKYDYRISSDGTTKSNSMMDTLNKYNLINNKHIPAEYKCNDRNIRLQMLAGLIDSDGSYSNKCYEITQKSTLLANDILFLARSLGFAAYSKKTNNSWTYKGVKKTNEYNRIHISGDGLDEVPVKIQRKVSEVRTQIKDVLTTGIKVEKATDCGDYYGFTLDGNCRYLLGDFTVTHNTCSAVATVTSSFEREGYTILWVTRTTLKSDVYKNIFDDVCHAILAEQMRDEGLEIPDKNRRRLLSKSWIEPISYRTFSNLLESDPIKPTNKYGELLLRRNGPEDILRKTIIVIDEAHKLYGGDLKWSERPDMKIMERLLRNSYKKSGTDSARLLIMTATPFTDSPMELFKLINLCKEDPDDLITTDPAKFKNTYMNEDDDLTNAGSKKLADSLSGYISYLNRENDPTQFAQPIMIEVPAIMSHVEEPELRKHLYGNKEEKAEYREETKKEKAKDKATVKDAKDKLKEAIKTLKTKITDNKKTSNTTIKNRQERECKDIKNKAEKAACNKRIKIEEEETVQASAAAIQAEIDALKTQMGDLKVKPAAENIRIKIKELKEKMLQEVMLVDRCKSIVMKK